MVYLNNFLDSFNVSEKDIVMFLFLGAIVASMLLTWLIEEAVKWYKRNRRYLTIDAEFIVKVLLVPVLSLILVGKGFDPAVRRKRVNEFLYT